MEDIFLVHDVNQNGSVILINEDRGSNQDGVYGMVLSDRSSEFREKNIDEGDYVVQGADGYSNANDNPRAIIYNEINSTIRDNLNVIDISSLPSSHDKVDQVKSYHINVGHGNCSIVLFRDDGNYNMWMIDCSTYDFLNRVDYSNNLNECFKYIRDNYGITKISKLLITHPHFDHINGIGFLLDKKYIDAKRTEIWLNRDYHWPGQTYNDILARLKADGFRFILPIKKNSTDNIKILYPVKNVCSPKKRKRTCDIAPDNKVNNASVLYELVFGNYSMLYTGDLETAGWKKAALPKYSGYFCHSHHGSENGLYYYGFNSSCIKKPCIVMGRDGAYSGIYCSTIENDIKTKDAINVERADHFIEFDWLSGTCRDM